jgi:hypothetical protein
MSKRTFILSDESVNTHGYRVLTAGIQLDNFLKNPIMLWNHSSTWRGTKDEMLPIGKWVNIRVEDNRLLADAVFDDGDDFAKEIARKVDKGILNMCSIGFSIVETSEEKQYILPGQRYATVSKCRLREASIVDMGSNLNSVVLYDDNDNIIDLSDSCNYNPLKKLNIDFKKNDMKLIAVKLGLSEAATETEILASITSLQDVDKQATALRDKIAALEKEQKDARTAEANTLIDAALKAGKIDAKAKDGWAKLFETDFDSAKQTLQSLPERTTLRSQVDKKSGDSGEFNLLWDELDKKNLLGRLRDTDLDLFKSKFKERFGVDYKG